MKIVSQTESQIVVRDSSLWMTAIFVLWYLVMVAVTVNTRNWKGLAFAHLLLLAGLVWLRRSTFTFDAGAQKIRWRRRRVLRVASGAMPFSAVQDIRVDESRGSSANVTIYRLTIVTASGDLPMADVYRSGREPFTRLRATLLAFVHGEKAPAPADAPISSADAARAAELNDSVRALLQQGRKVDAILLVQRTDHLDLTEATFRVNQVENQIRANKDR